eukprot:SAG22_NODE_9_length_35992_cov_37.278104_13_plen_198_part_00
MRRSRRPPAPRRRPRAAARARTQMLSDPSLSTPPILVLLVGQPIPSQPYEKHVPLSADVLLELDLDPVDTNPLPNHERPKPSCAEGAGGIAGEVGTSGTTPAVGLKIPQVCANFPPQPQSREHPVAFLALAHFLAHCTLAHRERLPRAGAWRRKLRRLPRATKPSATQVHIIHHHLPLNPRRLRRQHDCLYIFVVQR